MSSFYFWSSLLVGSFCSWLPNHGFRSPAQLLCLQLCFCLRKYSCTWANGLGRRWYESRPRQAWRLRNRARARWCSQSGSSAPGNCVFHVLPCIFIVSFQGSIVLLKMERWDIVSQSKRKKDDNHAVNPAGQKLWSYFSSLKTVSAVR